MLDLDDLSLFARVVEAGGFTAASRTTGIPKSRLSRRVAQLEDRLGVRLIYRTARSFGVTAVGDIVYGHAQKMMSEAEAAEAAANEALSEPSGTVRVTSSIMFGELLLASLISDFMSLYPKVRVVLDLSDRFVDLTAERYDLAIRTSSAPLADSSLVARRIWCTQMIVVASPTLVAEHGEPRSPEDLARLPCIGLGTMDAVRRWQFQDGGADIELAIEPRLIVNNLLAAAQAAARGVGFAQVPDFTCHRELAEGSLREVLVDSAPAVGQIHAVYPSRRGITSAVRMLINYLQARLSEMECRPTRVATAASKPEIAAHSRLQ